MKRYNTIGKFQHWKEHSLLNEVWTLPHKSSPPVSVLAAHNPQAEEAVSPSAPTRVMKLLLLLFVEVTHFVPHGLYVWQFQTDITCKTSNNVSFNILHFVKWDSFVYVAICQQNHVQGLSHYLPAALSHKRPHILECGNYENRMDLRLRWCIVKSITMTCKLTKTKVKEFPYSAIHFTPFSHQCRKQNIHTYIQRQTEAFKWSYFINKNFQFSNKHKLHTYPSQWDKATYWSLHTDHPTAAVTSPAGILQQGLG